MLKVLAAPVLRSPVIICALNGWSDAGFVASGAIRYLVLKREGQRIAEFNPDDIFAYTMTRPGSVYEEEKRVLQWPELAWHAISVPEAEHDLVILGGPEPNLRWQEVVKAISDYSQKLGASYMLTLGSFFGQVHYAGPPTLTGQSNDAGISAQLRHMGVRGTSYEGPTGMVTAISLAAHEVGIRSASIWAAAPGYLANSANPKLSASLLRVVEYIIRQNLDLEELEEAGREMEKRIEEILKSRPDLQTFMGKLEAAGDLGAQPAQPEEELPELPSAADVLKDLEDHLRRLRDKPKDEPEADQ